MVEFKSVILRELSNAEGKIKGKTSRGEDDASSRAASAAGGRGDEDNEKEEAEKQDVQKPSDARLTAVERARSSVNEETSHKRERAKSQVPVLETMTESITAEDAEDSACLPSSTNFDCLLSGFEPGLARRVVVNFEQEQSGHEVLKVRCATPSRKLLLELCVHLLRFRKCFRGEEQCIAFNARDEDMEWWVLQFSHYREMTRFRLRVQ